MTRYRITFAKTEAMRYIGNLDLFQTWERTLRRAGISLAYTQGFTPHPRMQLAAPLPLGFTGETELLDFWLGADLDCDEVAAALERAAPPGINLISIQTVDLQAPPLQPQVRSAQFVITLQEAVADLADRIQSLCAAESLPRERRDKPYDLRPLIESISLLPPDPAGKVQLFMQLTAQEGRTGRPEEVIDALGIAPEIARYCRTCLLLT